jgi:thymidylate kinase
MCAHKAAFSNASRYPFVITFSGIDGAGKTTQIENLSAFLEEQGLRVARLSFWDDVAVWSNFRAGVGGKTTESSENLTDGGPLQPRNNKHVRKWYLTTARSGIYILDILRLRRLLARKPLKDFDVVVFDRYVYDQIANVDSPSLAARAYRKFLLQPTPVPDLAFIIDTSPAAAFERKPEYPLEFMHKNRESFLRLSEIAPGLIVIPEGAPDEVGKKIRAHLLKSRLFRGLAA